MADEFGTPGISEATDAFEKAISPPQPARRGPPPKADKGSDGPIRMFDGIGDLENPDEEAGGDSRPLAGEEDDTDVREPAPRRPKAKKPEPESDEDEGEEDDNDPWSLIDKVEKGEDSDEEEEDGKPKKKDAEGEDEDGEDELETVYKVKVDGEEVEVPLKEALDGYIRTETFHRRLNEVNEAAQNIERQAGEVAQNRQAYLDRLTALTEQLDSLAKEPDVSELEKTDPAAALRVMRQWQEFQGKRQALEQEKQRVRDEQVKDYQRQLKTYVDRETHKMLRDNPQWRDPKVWDRDKTAMDRTAKAAGFSQEEIDNTYDSRQVLILLKASRYDRIVANRPKPKKQGKSATRPGSGASRTVPKDLGRANQRLARTGSVDAATDVFAGLLARENPRGQRRNG